MYIVVMNLLKYMKVNIMNRWEFTIKELKALQQKTPDTPLIVEAYVEWVLLNGYSIKKNRAHKCQTVS
jgi:hypothetical protein